jgi:hypothetical protein
MMYRTRKKPARNGVQASDRTSKMVGAICNSGGAVCPASRTTCANALGNNVAWMPTPTR